uniref:Kazal-like domain-containing protein n=1 Tax=Strigamia maritima TaxID=126957 RepID=T1IQF5_STRMM
MVGHGKIASFCIILVAFSVVGVLACGGKPHCDENCSKEINRVCGTDGVTYNNPCLLKKANCESNGKIQEDHTGASCK